ncbi:DUF3089 domain-containing protein [Candidatus Binatia bacterium]|jgi:hypothetical protein|nr:DUF3089 domain-containing protein [Candidatus Binatia bacterium]
MRTRTSPTTSALAATALLALLAAPARAAGPATTASEPYPGYRSALYADPASWLCRGDTDDVCDHDLDATIVRANGTTRRERWHEASSPKIDCFYVYPTISTDPGGNSDLVPGDDQELYVVRQQAARLGSVCRVFAPIYRQITLTALTARLAGQQIPNDPALAYADVVDAWKHYVANDNHGRGVILIGHSQGAGHLTALVRNEIDPSPELRARLVSAILLGTSLQVPVGADVGGDFQNVPLCRSASQTGCAISYASFRADAPPPSSSLFGKSRGPGLQAACTNPAALGGGTGALKPYLPVDGKSLPLFPSRDVDWLDPALGVEITTPLVALPGFLSAECKVENGFSYLSIDVQGDPSDPRIDDLTGADITPEWGLHLVDANAAMGNLVDVAEREARAFCGRQRRCATRPLARR